MRRRRGEECSIEDVDQDLGSAGRTELEYLLADYETLVEDLVSDAGPLDRGTRLGDFELMHEIGRGGMGVVWEAEQVSLSRRVALKLLHPVYGHSERVLDRFRREALAGSRLEHPAIVRVISVGEDRGIHYIAQELVSGARTLASRLEGFRRGEPVPPDWIETIIPYFAEVAEAVASAHAVGIIHRDLKPGNLMVTSGGAPKVVDFGLALLEDEPLLSRTGELSGTPGYMSPEQVAPDGGGLDGRTDVFSLGASLYEALTLERPFPGETMRETVEQILLEHPLDPCKLNRRLPRELAAICYRALEKEQADRYPDMGALAADLRRFVAREPVRAVSPGKTRLALLWCQRHRGLTAGFVGTVVALLIVFGLLIRTERAKRHDEAMRALLDHYSDVTRMALHDVGPFVEAYRQSGDPDDRVEAAFVLGRTLVDWKKNDQAASFYERVLPEFEGERWRTDHALLLMRLDQGRVARYRGLHEAGAELLRDVCADMEAELGRDHITTINAHRALYECLAFEDPERLAIIEENRKQLESKGSLTPRERGEFQATLFCLASWLMNHDRHAEAEEYCRKLDRPVRDVVQAGILAHSGREQEAHSAFDSLLHVDDPDHTNEVVAHAGLAVCDRREGATDEHLSLARELCQRWDVGSSAVLWAYWILGREGELQGADIGLSPANFEWSLRNLGENEVVRRMRQER